MATADLSSEPEMTVKRRVAEVRWKAGDLIFGPELTTAHGAGGDGPCKGLGGSAAASNND